MEYLNSAVNKPILHQVTGKDDDSFVGIKIKADRVDFYYPETFELSRFDDLSNFRNDVLAILKTIEIAKSLSNDRGKVDSSLSNNQCIDLVSYLWVINDYLENGLYINREKIFKTNQRGKVNWKRTLKNSPIISNGNIIYDNTVVEIRSLIDNIIVEINRYCVKMSIRYIGWLFNLNPNIIHINEAEVPNLKKYAFFLKQEIDRTFEDYKKVKLTYMLKIIQGINLDAGDNEIIYGVDSYYYIFEKMIDSIFGDRNRMKDFSPKANWFLAKNNFKKTPSSELRPDTLLIKDDVAYILDSKYYRFGYTANKDDLPETTSIQKQITYGDYLRKNSKMFIKDIRNAFILPYNMNYNRFGSNEVIYYIGFATSNWRENKEAAHENIYAFLIDMKHVIMFWNKINHDDDINRLVFLIENAIKEKEMLMVE